MAGPSSRPGSPGDRSSAIAPAPRRAILLLMMVYMFNMLDRQILTILVEPIKADLHLADWQIGAVSGLAFALLYTVGGILLARVADRGDRVKMIAAALTIWSGFTILSGFARNFGEMLLVRVGVGIGEAGCTPAAHSLITDLVPRERRASALAFYQLGVPLGAMVGLAMGGFVLSILSWRWAFFLAGAPGIGLAVIVLLVMQDPRRSFTRDTARAAETGVSILVAARTLLSKPAFLLLCLGSAMSAFAYFGQAAFLGSLYLRTHGPALAALAERAGMAPTTLLGLLLSVMVGVGGGIGTLTGGWLADRWGRQGLSGYLTICAAALIGAAPFFCGAALSDSLILSMAAVGFGILIHSVSYGPAYAAIQTLAEPRMRGMAAAIQILFVNAIGLALGPLFVGTISDLLRDSQTAEWSLRVAMSTVTVPLLIGGALLWFARKWVDGDTAT